MPYHQILILADEYMASAIGAVGHETIKTPHVGRLAKEGVMFSRTYSSSPMCVPAREVIQTGYPVHQIPCRDGATPYQGRCRGGYESRRQGHTMASVGKLHCKSSVNDNGYEPCEFGELGAAFEIGKLDGHQKRLPATVVPLPHFGPQKHPVRGDYAVWFEV